MLLKRTLYQFWEFACPAARFLFSCVDRIGFPRSCWQPAEARIRREDRWFLSIQKGNEMKHIAVAAIVGVSCALASAAQAQTINESICGASPGGLWSLVGAGLDAAVKAQYPGSTITYQTSSGGLANVPQVVAGSCAFGMANDGDLVFASKGVEPFKAPVEGLTAIAVLYDWAPVWWIARADFAEEHGIETLADLAEAKPPMRLVFNRRGLLTSAITESTLEAVGVSLDDISEWGGSVQFQASGEQSSLMQDGRVDMLANTLFEGHRSLTQMGEAVDLKLIGVPDDAAEAVIEKYGLQPWTISADANPWGDNEVKTVTTSIILFTRADVDEELVYGITKSMIENPDRMAAVSDAMKRFKPEGMKEQDAVPFHPGAVRAYKEAGLM
ncbi:TAXI family TRAP transporter solute-binding subunit [Pseudohoeflea coraliihabitans]|uniref:TAXI family TRAP transporter solute-binding subunit n=1 Tax=Pseudohoeflea coraliihabitans TaxID=2860393 RepID=A0ABS6WQA7_9HYPH|nr:TAXI family TRAP transporter solute-binding subunit [Pseudohoeflea sp. DP4N28-3]MBW3097245.1 TAXI family TRAP transporter solute-binding subunit [Pseudohoeflea sp. DP4N28-3]